MQKMICLVQIFLKSGIGKGAVTNSRNSQLSLAAFFGGAAVLSVLCFLGGKYLGLYIGKNFGTGMLIDSILMAMIVIIGVLMVPNIMSTFYQASGMGTLLALPFTAEQIAGAKLAVLCLQGYGVFLVIFLPFGVGYGIYADVSFSFWTGVLCSVMCIPIVTLCILCVILILFMRIFHKARDKELISILGAAGSMIVFLGVSLLDFAGGGGGQQMEQVLYRTVEMFGHMAFFVPVLPFLGNLFDGGSLWWAAAGVGVTLLVILLFFLVVKTAYLTGLLGMQDASHSAGRLSDEALYKKTRVRKAVWSYTMKDLKTVVRTPAFFLQGVVFTLGWPLLVAASGMFAGENETGAELLQEVTGSLEMLILIVFGAAGAATVLAAAMNNTAVLSVSREGTSFYIMKQFPMSYKKQLKAKRNAAMLICAAGSTLYLLIAGVVFVCMGILPAWMVLFALTVNISSLYLILDIQMMIGLTRPKLVWEDDAEIGKKNLSGVIIMLTGLIVQAAAVIGISILLDEIRISPIMLLAVLAGFSVGCAFLVNQVFYRYGVKRMKQL